MGAEPQGLVVGRLGRPGRALDVLLRPPEMGGIRRPRQSQAPCPTSHCGWGHAHLGGVQGVLGDVVLQAGAIAVASRPERQAPGRAHRAVLLDVAVASQDLWDDHTHDRGVGPAGAPQPAPCTAGSLHGVQGEGPWEDSGGTTATGAPPAVRQAPHWTRSAKQSANMLSNPPSGTRLGLGCESSIHPAGMCPESTGQ